MMRPRLPGIGMRVVKTAASVLVCMLLFHGFTVLSGFVAADGSTLSRLLLFLLNRPNPIFACVAAVVAMQSTWDDSLEKGGARIWGTGIGGVFGLLFLWLDTLIWERRLNMLLAFIGIFVVTYICLLLRHNTSVPIALVTFLIILITVNEQEPYIYALNRILDTSIGIGVSLLVNLLLGKPRNKCNETTQEVPPNDR